MSDNPFTYGNPIDDPARFVGRESEMNQIMARLRNAAMESSSIVGERRIGKSSLLNAVATQASDDGFFALSLDPQMLSSQATPRRFWDRVLHQLARCLPDEEIKAQVKTLRQAETLDTFDLSDLFDQLDDASFEVLLLVDEFERVASNANFGPDFFYGLRSLAIHHRLALVTASYAELSSLSHSADVRASPFFNIFATIHLGLFKPAEADVLFERYLAGSDVQFDKSERTFLTTIAGSHPFYLQIGGSFLFEAHQRDLPPEERLAFVRRRFAAEAEDTLAHTWRHSSDEEKISLLVLALLSALGDDKLQEGRSRVERASSPPPRTGLRQLLTDYFDEDELRVLCFDLNLDYNELPGDSKLRKVLELIEHFERRRRVPDLVAVGARLRPDVPWDDSATAPEPGRAAISTRTPAPASPAFDIERLSGYYSYAGPTLAQLARRGVVVEQNGSYALFSTVLAEWMRGELRAPVVSQTYSQWLREPANQQQVTQIRSDLADDVKERVLPRLKADYWGLVAGWLANAATIQPAFELLRGFVEA